MKMIALIGAAAMAVGTLAATPAAAQYHHGDRGGYGDHRGGYRGGHGYRHAGYGYRHGGYRRGWNGYRHHRVVCNRFGRCHRI